jgi:hypothetical protein
VADLQLNSSLDLQIDDNGSGSLTPNVAMTCAQTLIIGLSTFLGEWFLDRSKGVPYLQEIMFLVPEDATLRAIYSKFIQQNRYVQTITKLSLDVNRATRVLGVDFEVLVIDGSIVSISSGGLIVNGQVVLDGVVVVIDGVRVVIS